MKLLPRPDLGFGGSTLIKKQKQNKIQNTPQNCLQFTERWVLRGFLRLWKLDKTRSKINLAMIVGASCFQKVYNLYMFEHHTNNVVSGRTLSTDHVPWGWHHFLHCSLWFLCNHSGLLHNSLDSRLVCWLHQIYNRSQYIAKRKKIPKRTNHMPSLHGKRVNIFFIDGKATRYKTKPLGRT